MDEIRKESRLEEGREEDPRILNGESACFIEFRLILWKGGSRVSRRTKPFFDRTFCRNFHWLSWRGKLYKTIEYVAAGVDIRSVKGRSVVVLLLKSSLLN